ncbi:MAG: M90 family metallopeptidase [Wenzhouxiangella sp.]|jgi:Mlc titration factor MtfA (ptsG expression regulator)|nr:M90 family metallopeptidase [Wenzhouxiangella sp.]
MIELGILGAAIAAYVVWRWLRRRRRQAAADRPFPDQWRRILENNMPLYRRLPEPLRGELHRHVNLFLHDKSFQGFHGLEVTDEMRVTVAGHACLLLLNRDNACYSNFSSIYLYPSTFVSTQKSFDGVVQQVGQQARLGESWQRGPIVLAWDSVLHGARDIKDGHNVVLHEFAHKLDDADGRVDGAPLLEQRSHYLTWARVMSREFEQLQKHAGRGVRTVMDHYGATNPAEFFAVLTETFYEKPRQLRKKHPELYAAMQDCFQVDPLAWQESE